jgi:20S proteasome subunit alpha 1
MWEDEGEWGGRGAPWGGCAMASLQALFHVRPYWADSYTLPFPLAPQVFTQYASKRAFGTVMMFAAVDEEKGPQLYRIDPAGFLLGYKACAAGSKEQEATNWLEKKMKSDAPLDTPASVQRALMCLQTVLGVDFKADEVEVGLAERGERFRKLSEEEVEGHLIAIAEAD